VTTVRRGARRRSQISGVVHDARQQFRDERLEGVEDDR